MCRANASACQPHSMENSTQKSPIFALCELNASWYWHRFTLWISAPSHTLARKHNKKSSLRCENSNTYLSITCILVSHSISLDPPLEPTKSKPHTMYYCKYCNLIIVHLRHEKTFTNAPPSPPRNSLALQRIWDMARSFPKEMKIFIWCSRGPFPCWMQADRHLWWCHHTAQRYSGCAFVPENNLSRDMIQAKILVSNLMEAFSIFA